MNPDLKTLIDRKAEIKTIIDDIQNQLLYSEKRRSNTWRNRASAALTGYKEQLTQVDLAIAVVEKEQERQFQQIFSVQFHKVCKDALNPTTYEKLYNRTAQIVERERVEAFKDAH